ncbi:hypothetical protein LXL04_025749 [Taraxacum kok-saghyz]
MKHSNVIANLGFPIEYTNKSIKSCCFLFPLKITAYKKLIRFTKFVKPAVEDSGDEVTTFETKEDEPTQTTQAIDSFISSLPHLRLVGSHLRRLSYAPPTPVIQPTTAASADAPAVPISSSPAQLVIPAPLSGLSFTNDDIPSRTGLLKLASCFLLAKGLDRSGKTSQSGRLLSYLNSVGYPVESWRFPDRDTAVGKMISSYLTNQSQSLMEAKLKSGTSLIIDRYSYSGVAFSSAKGLDIQWCKAPEVGLLAPDLVMYLNIPPEKAAERGGYGGERYEQLEFQKNVAKYYEKLNDPSWKNNEISHNQNSPASSSSDAQRTPPLLVEVDQVGQIPGKVAGNYALKDEAVMIERDLSQNRAKI